MVLYLYNLIERDVSMIKVTVWNENIHEQTDPCIAEHYPKAIHGTIAEFLGRDEEIAVRTATLDMPECGLPDDVLDDTDVLIWWGHCGHDKVPDELCEKIYDRVLRGMGFIGLHSAHMSKPFRRILGTSCTLQWREGDRERVWCIDPTHPIAQGIPASFEIPVEEMYGERFDIPTPDELVFLGWFKGGEVFRSGCCWHKGYGKVFYFQPGHEYNPTFLIPEVQKIITNAVHWAAPVMRVEKLDCPHAKVSAEERNGY